MEKVLTGLDQLANNKQLQQSFTGNVALLCHSASVASDYTHALDIFDRVFKERFTKIFGPQHGLITDVQDNMIESDHFTHPHYNRPVYSLYSETRIPTKEMLLNIDHLFIDLQDVGTRIYTYIYTMTYVLEACAENNIQVIILDRPNPVGGLRIEGNILDEEFASFVGRHPLPVRHALTMAEVALMHQKYWSTKKCSLEIIRMQNYQRSMSFEQTQLPWVLPSPNMPTVETAYNFIGTVLYEGTNISEGRGTTIPLEILGHPKLNPWKFTNHIVQILKQNNLTGQIIRPIHFRPTFQKWTAQTCGGVQIHITDREKFCSWQVNQLILRELIHMLGDDFAYKQDPYEYEYEKNPVDLINGTDRLRKWYSENGRDEFLLELENENKEDFLSKRQEVLLY